MHIFSKKEMSVCLEKTEQVQMEDSSIVWIPGQESGGL